MLDLCQKMPTLAPDFLDTPRLHLRRLNSSDGPGLFNIFSNADVARYLSAPPVASPAEVEKKLGDMISHYAGDSAFQLAVTRKDTGELIGTCTIWNIYSQNRRGEIGYVLAKPFWGSGYMSEALSALINYIFNEKQFHRLEADIDLRNVSSATILERLGFKREGLMRERWIVAGEISDSALYGLLASDWRMRAETHHAMPGNITHGIT